MLLDVFMVLLGAGATMAAGIPMAVRAARAGFANADLSGSADAFGSRAGGATAGFTPLDLGPDPMQWPSAKPWKTSNLPIPEWPSKSWDDEHFGRHWRDGTHDPSTAAGADKSSRPATLRDAEWDPRQEQQDAEDARHAQKQRQAQHQRQARDAQRHAQQEEAQRRVAARQALEQRQAARTKQQRQPQPAQRPAQRPKPQGGSGGAPGRDELLQLVENVGLAGTVQEIMKRTGWDFRKAAQYLARVRSGG